MFIATDPTTGQPLRERPLDDDATTERKVAAAHAFAPEWARTPLPDRARVLQRVAALLRERREAYGLLMTEEMGKPTKEAPGEVDKAAWAAEHYAEWAERWLADEPLPSDATRSLVRHQPLGPVLGIAPWNAPFWLASRIFSPALMAGNPVLLKHDSHVPGCAGALEGLFEDAQAPEGLFSMLYAGHDTIGDLIDDPRIAAVSLTGSTRAGRAVGARAGAAIKPVVLELGGSDPAIVLPDADLDAAADALVISRMINAGQSCIAAKRLLVHDAIHDTFVDKVHARIARLKMGDPRDPDTDIGPLARADLRDDLHELVRASVQAGATCRLGGELPDGPGFFYPPTLLTEVRNDMAVCQEETFGPVASVLRVASADEALDIANDSRWGLAGSVWTSDVDQARRMADRMQVGQVAINGLVKTDPRLPSGGVKASGIGRELGPHGIRAFVNVQQLWIGPRRG